MKSYIVKIFAGASVSIIIAMNALNFLKLENIDSLEYMYIISYGGLFTFDIEHNIFGFFKILVPHILLIYLLAYYMYNDFKICSVYVFTRSNKRKHWFIKKYFSLLFITAVYYFVQFLIVFLIGTIYKFRPESIKLFTLIVTTDFILLTLTGFLLVISTNLLSFKLGTNFAYLSLIIADGAMIMLPAALHGVLDNLIIKLLPTSNGMLIWHSDNFLRLFSQKLGFEFIEGFSVLFSIIYILILLAAIFFIGIRFIEILDVINEEKEA